MRTIEQLSNNSGPVEEWKDGSSQKSVETPKPTEAPKQRKK